MDFFSGKRVYHGSPIAFGTVKPKHNRRFRTENGAYVKIFDEISFHATQYRWIALAYTYDSSRTFEHNGKRTHYNMAVDLYGTGKEITILGAHSLEESLRALYGKGGYVYHYDADHFFYTGGLGNREVITRNEIDPVEAELVHDPITELKKEGVRFRFVDLTKSENAHYLK